MWAVLVFGIVYVMTVESSNKGMKEYCPLESFNPVCHKDEIIIIQDAIYGRIRVGKCNKANFFLGCVVDVVELMDKVCSGLTSCDIEIPNAKMIEKLNCLEDPSLGASANLEASYICHKVYTPRSQNCRAPEKIKVSKPVTYIASLISKHTSCGLHGSPWILEVESGQIIDITLMDFSWNNQTDHQNHNSCPINYGYILDMESDDVVNVCGGNDREKHIYLSSGNSIQIVLESNALERNNFMLTFKAIGCPEYKPPNHSWIQKENDSLAIGCGTSDKTWKLKCIDNRWIGVVGNCTAPPESTTLKTDGNNINEPVVKTVKSAVKIPNISNNHVIVFTMACLTVLVCCIIIILGVYCIKRYDVKIKKYSSPPSYNTTASFKNGRLTLGSLSTTTYRPVIKQSMGTMNPPAYQFPLPNSDQGPQVPPRNGSCKENANEPIMSSNNFYQNVGDDESVQYYVLENPEEKYQNMGQNI